MPNTPSGLDDPIEYNILDLQRRTNSGLNITIIPNITWSVFQTWFATAVRKRAPKMAYLLNRVMLKWYMQDSINILQL